jgi:hypothetical protein
MGRAAMPRALPFFTWGHWFGQAGLLNLKKGKIAPVGDVPNEV